MFKRHPRGAVYVAFANEDHDTSCMHPVLTLLRHFYHLRLAARFHIQLLNKCHRVFWESIILQYCCQSLSAEWVMSIRQINKAYAKSLPWCILCKYVKLVLRMNCSRWSWIRKSGMDRIPIFRSCHREPLYWFHFAPVIWLHATIIYSALSMDLCNLRKCTMHANL